MDFVEQYAKEALNAAKRFDEVERIATDCAFEAVNELREYNANYAQTHKGLDGSGAAIGYAKPDPKEPVVNRLRNYYMTLLNRRGLVGL